MAPHDVISKEQPKDHFKKGIQSSKHNPLKEGTHMASNGGAGHSTTTTTTTAHGIGTQTGPRPTHFLIRPRLSTSDPAYIVPLIPADLLPEYIDIDGVPRHLTAAQTTGMECIGAVDRPVSSARYNLRFLPIGTTQGKGEVSTPVAKAHGIEMDSFSTSSSGSGHGEGTSSTSLSLPSSDTEADIHSVKSSKKKKKKKKKSDLPSPKVTRKADSSSSGSSPTPSSVDRILASASAAAAHHLTAPVGKKNKKDKQQQATKPGPDSSQEKEKEKDKITPPPQAHQQQANGTPANMGNTGNYCRHFCHHGTCKWGIQCRYQHTMPTTPEGLREVGLREWPAWLLRSIRVAENLNAGGGISFPVPAHHGAMHAPYHPHAGMISMGGMMPMAPYTGMPPSAPAPVQQHHHQQQQGKQQQVISAAERKRRDKERDERQVKKAEERLRALEAERAEAEKMERVRESKAMRMTAAHAAAAAAALRDGEGAVEMKLVDV